MSEAKGMKAFKQEAKEMGMGMKDQMHAYIYLRWTARYIRWLRNRTMPKADEAKKKHWEEHYHSKVLPLPLAEAIITLDHDIPLTDLEQIVPYELARDILLSSPTDVALYECGCRATSEHPCQPTRVCMVIGKPFADACLEINPNKTQRATTEEALQLLRDEEARGHIHTAWFKDVNLGRFYAICNCCDCCCGALQSHLGGTPMLAASGYLAVVDQDLCIGCGTCAERCHFHAISLPDGVACVIDAQACMGCGVCVNGCDQGALALRREPLKGVPLEIDAIL